MSRAVRVLALWAACMLVGVAVAWHSRFVADVSFFLPSHPTAEQQVLVDQLKEGAVSRLLMVAIDGGDATQRAALSEALRQQLVAMPEWVSVQNGGAGSLDAERDFLLHNRYLLSPAVQPDRFSVQGLAAAVGNTIDTLASPEGMLIKPYLTQDPTGELLELLHGFNPGAQPAVQAGVWASHDGERALLLLQTRALGSDTDGQEHAIATVQRTFEHTRQQLGLPDMQLHMSGPGWFAVQSRATIKSEVSRLTLISSAAIVLVLFAVYRSPRLMGMSLLPVLSGALAGVVVVSLVFGSVFGITVGFGSALIGESVDYAIYFFVQSGRWGVQGWRQRFWPTIRLGVLTSLFGFGALVFSGFPGLAQLGLYALSGVAAAALVTRFVLPALAGQGTRLPDPGPWVQRVPRALKAATVLRWPLVALACVALVYLVQHRGALWQANLSALSTVSVAESATDARLRADLGAPDARYMVVVRAPSREAALQTAEQAATALDGLVTQGVVGGYDSPTRFLPSERTQAARRASLPDAATLRSRLAQALVDSPLSATRLGPFVDAVQAARTQPLLNRDSLNHTGLALAVDALLLHNASGWTAMLPLRPAEGGADIPGPAVRAALAGTGALFIDLKGEFNALYSDYIAQAMGLALAGVLAIVLLLGVTLRSWHALRQVMLPLVMAVVLVMAGLHLLGERLHLLHLVGLLLIVAVGSNYALFFVRPAGTPVLEDATLLSMVVASVTTVIGFGTLALSSVPVLHAVGATVGPGALLALLLSAAFTPRAPAT